MNAEIDPTRYYRLPWSLNDNVLGWLEPTKACNLYCEGCYSRNDPKSHRTLEQVRSDLDVFVANRRMDSISIAGGDPLTHPGIVDIVRMVRADYGLKPIVNTNGLALTPELLQELKDAGVYGFTFHIDASQGRPKWKNKTELELNPLRLHYAEMVARAGGLSCSFNATVFPHTLKHVPDLMDWAAEHADVVHAMVFILFRTSQEKGFSYYAGDQPAAVEDLVYYEEDQNPRPLTARDVVRVIRERHPDFEPSAYLGGTKDPDSFKWLVAGRVVSSGRVYGYVGARFMELVQSAHHAATGRYLGYSKPSLLAHGRSLLLGFSPFDAGVRDAAARWAMDVALRPWRASERLHFQSILVIQPIDTMPDGEANMCDGCPDMTVHEGRLVWSCRLDELKQFGCFLRAVPRA